MIGATEFYATTPGLNAILWVEAVIYLSIGAYELLDDFAATDGDESLANTATVP